MNQNGIRKLNTFVVINLGIRRLVDIRGNGKSKYSFFLNSCIRRNITKYAAQHPNTT